MLCTDTSDPEACWLFLDCTSFYVPVLLPPGFLCRWKADIFDLFWVLNFGKHNCPVVLKQSFRTFITHIVAITMK